MSTGGFEEEDTGRMAGEKARGANGLEARVVRLEKDADRLYARADKMEALGTAVLTALGDMKAQLAKAVHVLAAAKHLEVPAWLIAASLSLLAAMQVLQMLKGNG